MHPHFLARFWVCLSFCVGGLATGAAAAQDGPPPAGFVAADLGTLGGDHSWSTDLTAAGQVVGDAQAADGRSHAFLWQGGAMTDLFPEAGRGSQARAITETGLAVGYADAADGSSRPVVWRDGVMTDLGTLGGAGGQALAVSEAGHVVGRAGTAEGGSHAFLWRDGVMTDLGTLGGVRSIAYAINEASQVVGSADTADGHSHASSGGTGPSPTSARWGGTRAWPTPSTRRDKWPAKRKRPTAAGTPCFGHPPDRRPNLPPSRPARAELDVTTRATRPRSRQLWPVGSGPERPNRELGRPAPA